MEKALSFNTASEVRAYVQDYMMRRFPDEFQKKKSKTAHRQLEHTCSKVQRISAGFFEYIPVKNWKKTRIFSVVTNGAFHL